MPRQLPARASALGWVEAWRGPCTHWVATDERGEIARVKITDPSFLNWPGIIQAVPGNIVPDFPGDQQELQLLVFRKRPVERRGRPCSVSSRKA